LAVARLNVEITQGKTRLTRDRRHRSWSYLLATSYDNHDPYAIAVLDVAASLRDFRETSREQNALDLLR
jgi:hypothetical protein